VAHTCSSASLLLTAPKGATQRSLSSVKVKGVPNELLLTRRASERAQTISKRDLTRVKSGALAPGDVDFTRPSTPETFGSVLVEFALLTGAMSGVLVRVHAANADPADPGVEVELPVAPGGWGSEHTERVANAVGVDTHSACVSLRFADGASEGLPAGRGGWRMITAM
jgi:hypothetical protein